MSQQNPKILALTGGVGGAKLALGLANLLTPDQLMLAVNTGDDFEHFGLHISPDVDTLTYTLSSLANTEYGWGRQDESWACMESMAQLGGDTWFNLGDRDLALHLRRTEMLRQGQTLSQATTAIAQALGIRHPVVPMSDDSVRTQVHTKDGDLPFQHYFVRDACKPKVTGFEFAGIEQASVQPQLLEWLQDATAVIICPSNPFVSVDPILNLPGMREALANSPAKVIAVSPIVGGSAIKGPTAKMMRELNIPCMADEVANHYSGLLDGFVLDELDKYLHGELNVTTAVAQSVMTSLDDKINLARTTLAFADDLNGI